jgi:hypothetical protein
MADTSASLGPMCRRAKVSVGARGEEALSPLVDPDARVSVFVDKAGLRSIGRAG